LNLCSTDIIFTFQLECTYDDIHGVVEGPVPCSNPWAVTNCVVLTICLCFLFLKINFILKLIVGVSIFCFYGFIVFEFANHVYAGSVSYNPALDAKAAHFLNIAFTLLIFHMIDRQTEYVARVDYSWKQQLWKKHDEAEVTEETNKILVQNILPSHVGGYIRGWFDILTQPPFDFIRSRYLHEPIVLRSVHRGV
jgi:adenylate cyclase